MRCSKITTLLFILICLGCTSRINRHVYKYQSAEQGLRTSISAFCHNSTLYDSDSIFKVNIIEDSSEMRIDISNHFAYIEPLYRDTIGALSNTFPCKVIIIDNKLFCIYTPKESHKITQRVWEIYKNKHLVDTLWLMRSNFYDTKKVYYRPSDFWNPAQKERYIFKK